MSQIKVMDKKKKNQGSLLGSIFSVVDHLCRLMTDCSSRKFTCTRVMQGGLAQTWNTNGIPFLLWETFCSARRKSSAAPRLANNLAVPTPDAKLSSLPLALELEFTNSMLSSGSHTSVCI